MTHSLGMPCGVIPEGWAYAEWLMAVFDPCLDGRARLLPASPVSVPFVPVWLRDERVEIAIGAPGGTQIAMGVVRLC